jgi:hypothetical protein
MPPALSSRPFAYPLPGSALQEFCHPDPLHPFAAPLRWDDEALAANSYIAIRARRLALDLHDLPPATPDLLSRVERLPWAAFPSTAPAHHWGNLDDHRGDIYARAPIRFLARHDGRWITALSPAWRIAGSVVVPLSMLQLIARLPRAEVYLEGLANGPLYFRFTGGLGIMPNLGLDHPNRIIFRPKVYFDGTIATRERPRSLILDITPPPPEAAIPDWPPVVAED